MNIKKIISQDRLAEIDQILKEFYLSRPDCYGLLEREQLHYDEYANIIVKYVKINNPSILDIGSGSHRIPITIAEKLINFNKIYSLDYYSEEKLIEYNKNINDGRIKLVTNNNDKFPFEDNTFDFVSSLCVFEHILNVDIILKEIKRVLKPNGKILIMCPNWSGVNSIFHALHSVIFENDRYWRYETINDILMGVLNISMFYLSSFFNGNPKFILIEPRIKNNTIDFERSDDDVVHLCHPISFKKWFRKNNFKLIKYNRLNGKSKMSMIFNTLFPSLATTNFLIAQKKS